MVGPHPEAVRAETKTVEVPEFMEGDQVTLFWTPRYRRCPLMP